MVISYIIGVLAGIVLYLDKEHATVAFKIMVVVFLLVLGLMLAGRSLLGSKPVLGWLLIETWVLAAVIAVACAMWVTLQVESNLASWFYLDAGEEAAVTSAIKSLLGAVFMALLFKKVNERTGWVWTGTQFRNGLRRSFGLQTSSLPRDTASWDAVWEDRVRDKGPKGWGFVARWKRAKIIRDHLEKKQTPPPKP